MGCLGSLSTHSLRFPGFPYSSLMPFVADGSGCPVFFISSMAMHTQNLLADERSSLLITPPEVTGDPLASARLTLIGRTKEVSADNVRDLYFSRHENARAWQDFPDFSYYRLEVEGVYFIGGFGVMGWLSAKDYTASEPDPLAAAAPQIIQHVNADHRDSLRRIAARETGHIPDEAWMTAIDRLGFHLHLKTGHHLQECRIAFPRELKDAGQVRAAFIDLVRACS